MQGKKQQLEWDMEQWYNSKLGKKCIKAVYCHPACLTYMLSESESHSVKFNSLQTHGLSPWNSPGKNTGVGSLSLFQSIFPTQGSNPGLPHCRQILYCLSHQRSPANGDRYIYINGVTTDTSGCMKMVMTTAISVATANDEAVG